MRTERRSASLPVFPRSEDVRGERRAVFPTQKTELEQAVISFQAALFCIETFSSSIKGGGWAEPLSDALDLNFNQAALPEYFISLDCLEEINLHIKVSQAIGFATPVPAQ